MLTTFTALALAAAAQTSPTAPAPDAHAQHGQTGQTAHSQMDHSRMGQADMVQHAGGCCRQGADGKMECAMSHKAGTGSSHQGHSGR